MRGPIAPELCVGKNKQTRDDEFQFFSDSCFTTLGSIQGTLGVFLESISANVTI